MRDAADRWVHDGDGTDEDFVERLAILRKAFMKEASSSSRDLPWLRSYAPAAQPRGGKAARAKYHKLSAKRS